MNLTAIAQQCEGAHRDGEGWRARCPVHQGKSDTSLHIWEDSGKLRIHCHGGCTYEALAAFFNLSAEASPSMPDAIYSYHTDLGYLLFQVCKNFSPRRFYQRRPDPADPTRWINNLGDIIPPLYRLPEVITAIRTQKPIYVVEGEKDVETLRAQGVVATCNSGGAKKWRGQHTQALQGAHVVVLPDNDAPGREHAAMICSALEGVAASVACIELPGLPDKGDVTDWLQTHTLDDLQGLVSAERLKDMQSHVYEMSGTELMQQQFKPIEWFAENLLHEGMVLFGGKSKRGKSWIMLNLAAAIASGGIAFGHYEIPQAVPVLYCALEDGPRRTKRRLEAIDILGEIDYTKLKFNFRMPPLEAGGIDYLKQHIIDGYKVIVIDVLAHVETAGKNGLRDYHEVYKTFAPLQELRSEHSFALVMVTHLRKAESEEVFDNLHGSVAYQGAQDALWVLERKSGEETANLHLRDKDAEDKVVALKFDGNGTWSFVGEGEEYQSSKAEDEVIRFLREEGRPCSVKDILMGLGMTQAGYGALRVRLTRMFAKQLIGRTERGKYVPIARSDWGTDDEF